MGQYSNHHLPLCTLTWQILVQHVGPCIEVKLIVRGRKPGGCCCSGSAGECHLSKREMDEEVEVSGGILETCRLSLTPSTAFAGLLSYHAKRSSQRGSSSAPRGQLRVFGCFAGGESEAVSPCQILLWRQILSIHRCKAPDDRLILEDTPVNSAQLVRLHDTSPQCTNASIGARSHTSDFWCMQSGIQCDEVSTNVVGVTQTLRTSRLCLLSTVKQLAGHVHLLGASAPQILTVVWIKVR